MVIIKLVFDACTCKKEILTHYCVDRVIILIIIVASTTDYKGTIYVMNTARS